MPHFPSPATLLNFNHWQSIIFYQDPPNKNLFNPVSHLFILELIPRLHFIESCKLLRPQAAERDKGAHLDFEPCCPLCTILPKASVSSKHINQTPLSNISHQLITIGEIFKEYRHRHLSASYPHSLPLSEPRNRRLNVCC